MNERDRWLACAAAALGVSLAACKKDDGAPQAREVPAPTTFTIPPPHDTVFSVAVTHPNPPDEDASEASVPPEVFQIGVGGDGDGLCWQDPPPVANSNPICGAVARMSTRCETRKPPARNVRATVHARKLTRAELEKPFRAALEKIMQCGIGRAEAKVTLVVDASGRTKASSRGTNWMQTTPCVFAAFGGLVLPQGPDEIVIDLASS